MLVQQQQQEQQQQSNRHLNTLCTYVYSVTAVLAKFMIRKHLLYVYLTFHMYILTKKATVKQRQLVSNRMERVIDIYDYYLYNSFACESYVGNFVISL